MSTIPIDDKLVIGPDRANIDARYKASNNRPYASVAAAEAAINLVIGNVGLTVLVADENDPNYPEAKEYWVQPKGTTPETYGLVEKGAGVTDYNDLDNKPTIGDGTNTALPIVGNVKVSASTASGDTAGVTVTPGQNTGEIEMSFTLPKGEAGQNGADGADGQDGAPGHNPCLGRFPAVPNPMPNGQIGDYIYVDTTTTDPTTQEETTTTTVYHYGSNGWDGGAVIDADHPTLASGQSVTAVHIKDEIGDDDPNAQGVLSAEAGKNLNTGRYVAKLVNKRVYKELFKSGYSYLIHLKENDILLISKTTGTENTKCCFFENNPEDVNWDYSQMVLYHDISLASTYPDTTFSVEVGKEYWAMIGNGDGTGNLPSELILNNEPILNDGVLTQYVDTTVESLPKLVEESRAESFKIEPVKLIINKLNSYGKYLSSSVNAINKYPIPANCIIELNEGYIFPAGTPYTFCYYDKKGGFTRFVTLRSKNTNIMQFYEKDSLLRFTIAREDGTALTSEELGGIIKKITYVEPAKTTNFGVKQIVRGSYKDFINNVDYTDVPYDTSYVTQYAPLDMFRMPNYLPVVLKWIPYPAVNRYMVQLSIYDDAFYFNYNNMLFESEGNSICMYNLRPNTTYYYMIGAVIGDDIVPYGTGKFAIENFPIRPIYMADVDNMRDLGGWKIGTTQRVKYGRLFRGASGNRSDDWPLVDDGRVEACVRLGITTEFDIGADGNLTESCITARTKFNVTYCQSYPKEAISETGFLLNYPRALHYIVQRLNADSNIWFHCSGGADRTGSVAFVLNALLGVSESDLNKDYELTTFSESRVLRKRTSTSYDFKGMVAYFKSIVVPGNPDAELKDKVEYWLLSSQSLIPESENINIADDIAAFRSIMIENV